MVLVCSAVFLPGTDAAHKNQQQKQQTANENPTLIPVEMCKKNIPILIKIISKACEYSIPKQDTEGGTEQVSHQGLFHCPGNKTNICSAQGNKPADKNSAFTVVSKGPVRTENWF